MNLEQACDFIAEHVTDYWEALDFCLRNIGPKPEVDLISRPVNWAGMAYYNGRVAYNLAYFISHHDMQELKDTIAHELCHIVQYRIAPNAKQAHGPEFRHYMQCIGFSGKTYHNMSASKAKSTAARHFELLMEVEI